MEKDRERDRRRVVLEEGVPNACWIFRDADDYRAGHRGILLVDDTRTVAYEVAGWRFEEPVDRVLAAAGFTSAPAPRLRVVTLPDDVPITKVRGFLVPEGRGGDLQMMLRRDLMGQLGGWHPVVMSQAGFHRAPWLFDYLWRAVGCPPIMIRHPDLVSGRAAGIDGPRRITSAAANAETLRTLIHDPPED